MDITIDRAIERRSGVDLAGHGDATIIRKGPGRAWPLLSYHNYGMRDVPLETSDGLAPGMTVSVRDDRRGGFYSTFARITWVGGGWVGLDHGMEADYTHDAHPALTTAHPLLFGHDVRDVVVRGLTLDGGRDANPYPMDACRGAAVYFLRSDTIEVTGVTEQGFHGEGMGFQMCRGMRIRGCTFSGNTGNGLHPGAGSTDVLFENCTAERNGKGGLFFCVRANHVTVRGCRLAENTGPGVSVGTRDSYNLIEDCRIAGNGGAGVLFRGVPPHTEAHSCMVKACRIDGNAWADGRAQAEIATGAHHLAFVGNTISPGERGAKAGILMNGGARQVLLRDNTFEGCDPPTEGDGFVDDLPDFACGHAAALPEHFRHLA